MGQRNVWFGFDAREMRDTAVAMMSATVSTKGSMDMRRLSLLHVQAQGLYTRPTEERNGRLWDVISEAPMSTEHAIARFFVPMLEGYRGWALFVDGDVVIRTDLDELFALADERYAVMVVKHADTPQGGPVKKDGDVQTSYARKNWSSVVLFNCGHPANRSLGTHMLNTLPGRDLHRFCWLSDAEIGTLPAGWNHLVGVEPEGQYPVHIAHFTLGTPAHPDVPGPYVKEYWDYARIAGYLPRRQDAPAEREVLFGLGR